MDDINDLTKKFQDSVEHTDYSVGLFKLNEKLTKENTLLKEKVVHLENLLLSQQNSNLEIYKNVSDAEIIAIEQLKLLKAKSFTTELSYDEVKKCSEFFKIITSSKPKKDTKGIEGVPVGELLDFVQNLEAK